MGDVFARAGTALGDGKVTRKEAEAMIVEIDEAIRELSALRGLAVKVS